MNVFYGVSRTTAPDSIQFLVNSGETLGGWRKTVGVTVSTISIRVTVSTISMYLI